MSLDLHQRIWQFLCEADNKAFFLAFGNMDVPGESYFVNSFQRRMRSISVQIVRIVLLTFLCDFNVGEGWLREVSSAGFCEMSSLPAKSGQHT